MKHLEDIYQTYPQHTKDEIQVILLSEILDMLKSMKQQEYEYWQTWYEAKQRETKEKEGISNG